MTQADIERLLLQANAMKDRFRPHPTIPGAYHLWSEGAAVSVTFEPHLFDEHPNTLRLLSYNEELFHQLLGEVATPEENALPPWIVRLASDDPPLCAYWRSTSSGIDPVHDIRVLEAALGQETPSFDHDRLAAAQAAFDQRVTELNKRESEIRDTRKRAEEVALEEKGRHLLLQATYIDLAMAPLSGLYDRQPNLNGFTEEAVRALRRHGYPFAPLLVLVGTDGISPTPSDEAWARVQGASRESLQKKFDALKEPVAELVQKLSNRSKGNNERLESP